jgi:chromosome segregation ATPase
MKEPITLTPLQFEKGSLYAFVVSKDSLVYGPINKKGFLSPNSKQIVLGFSKASFNTKFLDSIALFISGQPDATATATATATVTEQNQGLDQELMYCQTEINELYIEIEELHKELGSSLEKISQLEKDLAVAKQNSKDVKQLQNEIDLCKNDQKKIDELKTTKKEQNLKNYDQTVQELIETKAKLDQLQVREQDLVSQLEKCGIEQSKLVETNAQLKQSTDAELAQTQKQIVEFQLKEQNLKNQIEMCKKDQSKDGDQIALELKETKSKLDQLQLHERDLVSQLEQCDNVLETKSNEFAQLKQTTDNEVKQTQKQLADLQLQIKENQLRERDLLNQLEMCDQENSKLESTLPSIDGVGKGTSTEGDGNRPCSGDLRSKKDDISKLNQVVSQLNQELETKKGELNQTRKELEAKKDEISKLNQVIKSESGEELKETKIKLSETETKLANLELEEQDLLTQIEVCKKDKDNLEKSLQSKANELLSAKSTNQGDTQQLKYELDQTKEKLEESQKVFSELQLRYQNLLSTMEMHKKDQQTLETSLADKNQELEFKKKDFEGQVKENINQQQFKNKLEESQKQRNELEVHKRELLAKIETYEKEHATLEKTIEDQSKELEATSRDLEAKRRELESFKGQQIEQGQSTGTTQELTEAKSKLENSEKQLVELKLRERDLLAEIQNYQQKQQILIQESDSKTDTKTKELFQQFELEKNQLTQEIEKARERESQCKEELQKQLDENKNIIHERELALQSLENEKNQLTKEITELKQQLTELSQKLEDTQTINKEQSKYKDQTDAQKIDDLKRQLNEAQLQNQQLQLDLENLEKASEREQEETKGTSLKSQRKLEEQLENKNRELQEAIQKLNLNRETISSLEQKISTLEQNLNQIIESSKSELSDDTAKISYLQSNYAAASRDLESCKAQLTDAKESLSLSIQKESECQRITRDIQDANKKLQNKVNELSTALEITKKDLENMKLKEKDLLSQIETIDIQLDNARNTSDQQDSEMKLSIQNLMNERSKCNKELELFKSQSVTTEKDLQEITNELESSRRELTELESLYSNTKDSTQKLEIQNQQFQKTIKDLENKVSQQTLELQRNERQIEEKLELEKELQITQGEIANLQMNLQELKLANDQLKKDTERENVQDILEIKDLKDQISKKTKDYNELEAAFNKLQTKLDDLQKETDKKIHACEEASESLKQCETNIDSLVNQKDSLTKKLSETETKLANIETGSQADIDKLKDENDHLQRKIQEVSEQLENETQRYIKLSSQQQDQIRELSQKEELSNRLQEESKNLESELMSLKNELEQKSRIINDLTQEKDSISSDLERVITERKDTLAKLETCELSGKESVSKLEQELELTKTKLADTEKSLALVQGDSSKVKELEKQLTESLLNIELT